MRIFSRQQQLLELGRKTGHSNRQSRQQEGSLRFSQMHRIQPCLDQMVVIAGKGMHSGGRRKLVKLGWSAYEYVENSKERDQRPAKTHSWKLGET